MLLSKCVECDRKNSGFIKNQEGIKLFSYLGLKTRLSKITLLCDILL